MTGHEPPPGEPPESPSPPQDEGPPPDERPGPPTATHLRPLPHPKPDPRHFATPIRLPPTRPRPAKPEPKPEPRPEGPQPRRPGPPVERVTFPIAKPPPGIPPEEPPDEPHVPLPTPAHPRPVGRKPPPGQEPSREEAPTADAPQGADARPPAPALTVEAAPAVEPGPETGEAATGRRGSLYGYGAFLALTLGTFPLPGQVRYVLLWTVLLVLGGLFVLFDDQRPPGAVDPLNFTWGAGVGFVLGLPVMLMASRALARTADALLPIDGLPALFQALVLTWPLGETLFYRGAIQREHGMLPAALAAALGNALLYWPETEGVFAVLFVAVIFATALALVYGYVRRQYGLAAAFACQVVTNTMLLLVPLLLAPPV